jgi:hypothetical protein
VPVSRKTDVHRVASHVVAVHQPDAAPRRLETVASEVAVVVLGKSQAEAADFASHKLAALTSWIEEEVELARRELRHISVALNSSDPAFIQGSSYVQPNDDPATALAKQNRRHYDRLLLFIRSLTWRDFEACCRGVLSLLGCNDPRMTSASNDQGIDFHGRLSLDGRLDNFSHYPSIDSKLDVWMVGQAKHYTKTKVATPDLRELVGSIQLARSGTYADGGRALEGFTPRVCDPVFYLFFTTGSISRDGVILLKASGMISMDGPQLATFLADNQVGQTAGVFDQAAAEAWIKKFSS